MSLLKLDESSLDDRQYMRDVVEVGTCNNTDTVDAARVVSRATRPRTVQFVPPAADAVVARINAEVAARVRRRPRSPTNAVRRAGLASRPPAVVGT